MGVGTEDTRSGECGQKRSMAEAACALDAGGERFQWTELQRRGDKERWGPMDIGGQAWGLGLDPSGNGEPVRNLGERGKPTGTSGGDLAQGGRELGGATGRAV